MLFGLVHGRKAGGFENCCCLDFGGFGAFSLIFFNTFFPCLAHVFSALAVSTIIAPIPGIPFSTVTVIAGFLHALFDRFAPVSTG